MLLFNKKLKPYCKELRKNMTDAERLVWSKIRRKQVKGCPFYRQKNIGDYIVDFYWPAEKVVIEIDGGQHYSEEGSVRDIVRDEYMTCIGLKVLRFSDREVLRNIDQVIERIYERL